MHIKPLIEGFLKQKKEEFSYQEKIKQVTDRFLNANTRKHIHLKKAFRDHLVFSSDASSYSYDFNLNRDNLLAAVKKQFPEIKKITIKTG